MNQVNMYWTFEDAERRAFEMSKHRNGREARVFVTQTMQGRQLFKASLQKELFDADYTLIKVVKAPRTDRKRREKQCKKAA